MLSAVFVVRCAVGFGTGRTVPSGTDRSGADGFGATVGDVCAALGGAELCVSEIVSGTSEHPTKAAASTTPTTNRPTMQKK